MKTLDKLSATVYNVIIESDEYPHIFELPRYQRLGVALEIIGDLIDEFPIKEETIIRSYVARDYVTVKFYVEEEQ
jgi:hypothetical protein